MDNNVKSSNTATSSKDRPKKLDALAAEYHDNARLSVITETYSPEPVDND
jgi:hypothetical protein